MSQCLLVAKVLNNTASGFFSTVYTGTFFGTDLTVTVGLSLQDDVIPEMDQTIAVKITGVSGSYDVGSPDTAYVTILANDDPFGVLAFNSVRVLCICFENLVPQIFSHSLGLYSKKQLLSTIGDCYHG